MALAKIASLWIGPELSWLEQLCIQSFLDAGHDFTLFVYDDVKGVPDGVKIADANDHLKSTEFIRHARTGSPAYHADQFRLRMIRDTNLTWVDTDAYCVNPFVIGRHGHLHGWISDARPQINNGVLKLPKKSKTLKAMLDFTSDPYPIPPWYAEDKRAELQRRKDRGDGVHVSLLPWGVWGPNALTHFLHATGEVKHSQAKHVLYPVPFSHKRSLLKPRRRYIVEEAVQPDTLSIHFWGRRFRAAVSETGGIPVEGSYTADLLRKHGIDPKPTAHLMKPVMPAKTPAADISGLDFSMIDEDDVAVIDTAGRGSGSGRNGVLAEAFEDTQATFDVVYPTIDRLRPRRIAHIGPGYGFMDLLLHRRFGCEIVLLDDSEDGGLGDTDKARDFLRSNGVPEGAISVRDPDDEDLGEVDLAISFGACGSRYPASAFERVFARNVAPTGGILLDIRKGSGGIPYLKKFGRTTVLKKSARSACVFTQKAVI